MYLAVHWPMGSQGKRLCLAIHLTATNLRSQDVKKGEANSIISSYNRNFTGRNDANPVSLIIGMERINS